MGALNLIFAAAGQGFEPRLPGPEPGVLPLDDPAKLVTQFNNHIKECQDSFPAI